MRIEIEPGVRLYVDVEGPQFVPDGPTLREKPALVLLHGGPGFDHSGFRPHFGRVADIAQVIYVDHRGHGRSDRRPRGERHPALIFFHGGSRRQMLLGYNHMYYYSNAYSMNQYLANHGYVVLSVNYRSGIGYGLDFREALQYGATGESEFNDVLGAGLYLKARPDVDSKRIGAWGGSYGGYLTALALARASDLFAAGVDFHGVHDWNLEFPDAVPGYDAKAREQAEKVAFESSPMAYMKTWKSPVLLIQGDDDRNVTFLQTIRLAEALRRQNVYFEQLIFPNEIHDFLLERDWVKAYQATADFFSRKLVAHGRPK